MEVIDPRCCGLDGQLKSVTACLRIAEGGPPPRPEIRTYPTMPADLLAVGDWLASPGVTHLALESSGVSWKPIWHVLEGRFTRLLVNAQHVKAVPGRKTDVKDAEWLADLLRHGLLRGSVVPAPPQRELRDLTRLRTTRGRARAAEINRLLKTLAGTGLKLGMVVSDITGVSARAMLAARLAGEPDAPTLAALAKGRLRVKLPELERALAAVPNAHHRLLIAEHLAMIDDLDEVIARLDGLIAERLAPFAADLERLPTIPGVTRQGAEGLLAELGTDRSRFPSSTPAASWAALCPGHDESDGKRRSGKPRKGNTWLRALLGEAAPAVARTKDTSLGAQYHRLVAHRGKQQATIAVAPSILVRASCLVRDATTDQDPGGNDFAERDERAVRRRLIRRLERLGYTVTVEPISAA